MQGFKEKDRWFNVAVKVAREFMKAHIISSDSDRVAVVFYGSVSAYPAAGPPHLYSLQGPSGMCRQTPIAHMPMSESIPQDVQVLDSASG